MRNKKSQAALEFLMTYGWAILVVLIVFSALAYFGWLNPQALLPEKCTLGTTLSCKDFKMSASNGLSLKIINSLSNGIVITNISAVPQTGNPMSNSCEYLPTGSWGSATNVLHMNSGEPIEVLLDCGAVPATIVNPNNKNKWTLIVKYYMDDSSATFEKQMIGEMFAPIYE